MACLRGASIESALEVFKLAETKKEFTLEELKQYDGQDGRPVYIAAHGRVFDVTASLKWKNGKHMNRHTAGEDLSGDLSSAPHKEEVFDKFSQVGVLKTSPAQSSEIAGTGLPPFLDKIMTLFPFARRHPHPMMVHFPIVTMILSSFFLVLYMVFKHEPFDRTLYHLLFIGTPSVSVGIATGYITWKVNYMGKPMPSIIIKIIASLILQVLALIALIWRIVNPLVLTGPDGPHTVYVLSVLLFFPLVAIIGWFGAKLTFPSH